MIAEQIETTPFVMPPVRQGQTVLFFPYGERDGKPPHIGYIIDRKTGTVKIKLVDGDIKGAVRHISDPRLRDSPEARKDNGAWDYTEEERRDDDFRSSTESRLSALEKQVAGLIAQVAKKGKE